MFNMKSVLNLRMNGTLPSRVKITLQIVVDAIRALKCLEYLHESDEPVIHPSIKPFVVVYFYDILIYNKSNED